MGFVLFSFILFGSSPCGRVGTAPIDLTQLLAAEGNMSVDIDGFKAALEAQKNRSRKATAMAGTSADSIMRLAKTGLQHL